MAASYAPDLNPIENAELEALLGKAAERTRDGPRDAVAAAIENLSPSECANSFNAAGHEPE